MNVEVLIGQVITGFLTKEAPAVEDQGYEVCDAEFYSFTTSQGYCDIELRVEHNGYYGGWLNTPSEEVDENALLDSKVRQITKENPVR